MASSYSFLEKILMLGLFAAVVNAVAISSNSTLSSSHSPASITSPATTNPSLSAAASSLPATPTITDCDIRVCDRPDGVQPNFPDNFGLNYYTEPVGWGGGTQTALDIPNSLTSSWNLYTSCAQLEQSAFSQWLLTAPVTANGSTFPAVTSTISEGGSTWLEVYTSYSETDFVTLVTVGSTFSDTYSIGVSAVSTGTITRTQTATTEEYLVDPAHTDAYYISSWYFNAASLGLDVACCSSCYIFGGSVQVYHWPTPAPSPAVSTLVDTRNNFTFVSPSVYVAFQSLYAKNLCSTVGNTVYASTTIAFEPGQLSTTNSFNYSTAAYDTDFLIWPDVWTAANFDSAVDCASTIGTFYSVTSYTNGLFTNLAAAQSFLKTATEQVVNSQNIVESVQAVSDAIQSYILTYKPCEPLLSVPPILYTLNKNYTDCVPGITAFFDPPWTLTAGNGLVTFATAAAEVASGTTTTTSPAVTGPSVTPTTPTPTSTPAPAPTPTTSSTPVAVDPGTGTTSSSPVAVDPGAGATSSNPVVVDPGTGTTSSNPVAVDPGTGTTSSNPVAVDPGTGAASSNPVVVDPGTGTTSSNPVAVDPVTGTNPAPSPNDPLTRSSIVGPAGSTVVSNDPGTSTSPAANNQGATNNPQGTTVVPADPGVSSSPHASIIVPADPATSTYLIGSQTLAPGGSPITVSGTVVSLIVGGSSVVVGGTTQPLSAILATPVTTSSQVEYVLPGSQTLTAGGVAVTISGSVYSLASGGSSVVVAGKGTTITQAASALVSEGAKSTLVEVTGSYVGGGIGGIIASIGGFTTTGVGAKTTTAGGAQGTGTFNGTMFTGVASGRVSELERTWIMGCALGVGMIFVVAL